MGVLACHVPEGIGPHRVAVQNGVTGVVHRLLNVPRVLVQVDRAGGGPHGHKVLGAADQVSVALRPEGGGVAGVRRLIHMVGYLGVVPLQQGAAAGAHGQQPRRQKHCQHLFHKPSSSPDFYSVNCSSPRSSGRSRAPAAGSDLARYRA